MRNRKWNEKVSRLAVLALLAVGAVGFPLLSDGALVHRWSFNDGTTNDSVGTAHGTLYGTATIVDNRLRLSGSSEDNRMEATLGNALGPNKTLVAWFTLTNSDDNSPDGGPLSVGNASFDAIVYGERTGGQWMNGSDGWSRTPQNNGGAGETLSEPNEIMISITYDSSAANKIKIYRNGVLYAEHNQGSLISHAAGQMVLIGPRNWSQYNDGYMNGYIDEARIYNTALTDSEVAALYAEGPNPVPALQVTVTAPANGQQFSSGSSVTATVSVANGTTPYTVTYYTNSAVAWSTNNASTNLFTIPLGALAVGTYTNYATVTDNVLSNATSTTNIFTVSQPLVHRWSFNDGTANDSVGTAHGTLYGTATITAGRLSLSGSSGNNRMGAPLGSALGTDKTLVAWLTLSSLAPNNTSGGPLSVGTSNWGVFDAIVYGERTGGQWMNGSDFWNRTLGNNGGAAETLIEPNEIMISITYDSTAVNKIKIYRNGELYAQHNQGTLASYAADGKVLIGPRAVTDGYMNGYINEARIYNTALTASEIAALYAQGPDLELQVTVTAPANGQQFLAGSSVTGTVTVANGTMPYTVTYYMNGAEVWTTNNASTNLFTIPLGVLAVGTYTNYATVTDSVSSNATSDIFTVFNVYLPPGNTGTGGVIMYTDSNGSNAVANPPYIGGYVVHTFTNSGTLNIPVPASADVLVVAGGGAGGTTIAGGGGGGGLLYTNLFSITASSNYSVVVGVGGVNANVAGASGWIQGGSGSNSQFGTALIAYGGGGGGGWESGNGIQGGSGGGGANSGAGGANSPSGQGYPGRASVGGAPAGGGGGASSQGSIPTTGQSGTGGAGLPYGISGLSIYYAGGGGGGAGNGAALGAGGLGGGGAGGPTTGVDGTNGLGGGGGGGGYNGTGYNGGNGGSGIVIVRYPYTPPPPSGTLISFF